MILLGFLASACAAPQPSSEVRDPLEGLNRTTHAVNKALDTVAVRPTAQVYGTVLPEPVRQGVNNFADNLGLPNAIVNNTLQGDLASAFSNGGRFVVNTVFGFGGLLDPAGELGVPERETDFGETLHVWGFGEGVYVELPLLGPSNMRDSVGEVVDIFLDPLDAVIPSPESDYAFGTRIASLVDQRYRFGDTLDSILYESADSYAQSRLIYTQNRRFELGQTVDTGAGIDTEGDIYDDLYFE